MMIQKLLFGTAFAICFLLTSVSRADHGRDFLMVQTSRVGEVGELTGIARQDYSRTDDLDNLAFEPLLALTARNWLSVEINSDAEKVQGESLKYEATVVGFRARFTPSDQALGLGMAARYEIAAEDESSDALKLSSLASYQIDDWLLATNINYEKAEGAVSEWGYGLAAKKELRHHLALGLEVAGSFEDEKSGEVIAGVFSEVTHDFQINAGVGTGFNSDVDLTVKTALIWRFN